MRRIQGVQGRPAGHSSLVAVLPVPLLSMVIQGVVSKCVSTISHEAAAPRAWHASVGSWR
jgi:hypothetical protein